MVVGGEGLAPRTEVKQETSRKPAQAAVCPVIAWRGPSHQGGSVCKHDSPLTRKERKGSHEFPALRQLPCPRTEGGGALGGRRQYSYL